MHQIEHQDLILDTNRLVFSLTYGFYKSLTGCLNSLPRTEGLIMICWFLFQGKKTTLTAQSVKKYSRICRDNCLFPYAYSVSTFIIYFLADMLRHFAAGKYLVFCKQNIVRDFDQERNSRFPCGAKWVWALRKIGGKLARTDKQTDLDFDVIFLWLFCYLRVRFRSCFLYQMHEDEMFDRRYLILSLSCRDHIREREKVSRFLFSDFSSV